MSQVPAILVASMVSLAALNLPAAEGESPRPQTSQFLVYLGTYTGQKSKGIYLSRFNAVTGGLSAPELAAETRNPTFLAVYPRWPALASAQRVFLFAANEVGGGGQSGGVSAYAADRSTGKLTFVNRQSSRGVGPCHLSVDRTGRDVLVANYGSGSIAVLPIGADGELREATAFIQHTGSSVNPVRQEGPHAHWIDTALDNRFAFVCDLGLDKVMVYKLDPSAGSLAPNDPPFASLKPGSGPRHLAFHPNGRFAYVINEMGNTVTTFAYDARTGTLTQIETQPTLSAGATARSTTAEVEVHPSGRFLYGSNRGDNSLTVYTIEPQSGRLTFLERESTQGKTPRHFAIAPSGRWLLAANQDTDDVVVFRLDPATGRLTPTGESTRVGAPVCIAFVPGQ